MAIFGKSRFIDPVEATVYVTWCQHPPTGSIFATCRVTGVLRAQGLPASAVRWSEGGARISKWPERGETIPVVVDRADLTRISARWDVMLTREELGIQEAERLAQQWRAGPNTTDG